MPPSPASRRPAWKQNIETLFTPGVCHEDISAVCGRLVGILHDGGGRHRQGRTCQTEEVYNEQYRPQFHFSPLKNWMNDPNGMVFTVSSLATR